MRTQACEPCAKRKVRCDKGEPCSNCKRRKKDHCTYQVPSQRDRIKELEAIVRSLGGDTENAAYGVKQMETPASLVESSINVQQDPPLPNETSKGYTEGRLVALSDEEPPIYMEDHTWQNCFNDNPNNKDRSTDMTSRNITITQHNSNALQLLWSSKDRADLAAKHPPAEDATILWRIFKQRVRPIVNVSFQWELERLQNQAVAPELRNQLTDAEHAYVFAIYLIATHSLSEQDCTSQIQKSQPLLAANFQMLCEDALTRNNLFCVTDIVLIKALTVYMIAGLDRLSTSSLWSLIGLVIRNAQKIGLHRDGSHLDISPVEIEERRRLWWQLQHLDLILAIRSGMTSLTLAADWDTKLPLNIEDSDINPEMTALPRERKGLTSISYCLFTYWIIEQQRRLLRAQSHQFTRSILNPLTDEIVDELEEGLNQKFLQYCDVIRPMDILVQISARSLICLFRLRNMLLLASAATAMDEEHHDELMRICKDCLEYHIAYSTHKNLQPFRWVTQAFFPWHAFMCILVEISKSKEMARQQQSWDLLANLYTANFNMFDLPSDRRRIHAAELIVSAWRACKSKFQDDFDIPKPDFVSRLEVKLSEVQITRTAGQQLEPAVSNDFLTEEDVLTTFDLDFQDIDWAFWSSID